MSIPFTFEKQVAIAAVRRACVLTSSVFNKLVKNETITKDDKSPVTGMLLFFFKDFSIDYPFFQLATTLLKQS